MATQTTPKKRIVASFHNLPQELQDAVKEKYPLGFSEAMMRIDKPNGDFFYAVPYETDEVAYLVKIDVKIDEKREDDDEKDYYDDELNGADDLASSSDEEDGASGGASSMDDEM